MKMFKALAGAGLYLIVLAVLPRAVVNNVPPEVLNQLGSWEGVVTNLTILGFMLAALHITKTLTPKNNPLNLLAAVILDLIELYIFLFFIGFGDVTSLGKVEKQINMTANVKMMLDFRIFAQIMIAAFIIKMIVSVLEYINEKKKQATPKVV